MSVTVINVNFVRSVGQIDKNEFDEMDLRPIQMNSTFFSVKMHLNYEVGPILLYLCNQTKKNFFFKDPIAFLVFNMQCNNRMVSLCAGVCMRNMHRYPAH